MQKRKSTDRASRNPRGREDVAWASSVTRLRTNISPSLCTGLQGLGDKETGEKGSPGRTALRPPRGWPNRPSELWALHCQCPENT